MHVMDTECEKIGGGCLTAESAPELAKPSESPLLTGGDVKTLPVVKKMDGEKNLVNGDHPCTTTMDTTASASPKIADEEATTNVQEVVQLDEDEEEAEEEEVAMEMEEDLLKGTKEIVEDEEELLEGEEGNEELAEEPECQPVLVDDKEEEGAGEEDYEEGNVNKHVLEDEEEEEEEVPVTKEVVENNSVNVSETKESSPAVTIPVTVKEQFECVQESSKSKDDDVVVVSNSKTDVKPLSLTVTATSLQNKDIKEEAVVIPVSENEDKANLAYTSKHCQKEAEKRKAVSDKEGEGEVSSGSESDTSRKKIKVEPDLETTTSNEPVPPRPDHPVQQHLFDDDRERYIQEFISQCSQSVEEMDRAAERLHKEVETLAELARAKEQEWNTILRVRKIREEMLERLLRKRRLATEEYLDRTHLENSLHNKNINKYQGSSQLMMVPIVSSSPGGAVMSSRGPPPVRLPPVEYGKQRPILPKPCVNVNPNLMDPNCNPREGRNGPIVDVKSIIADYRSRHPESVPRRGRRLRGGLLPEQPPNRMSANPSLISMANMALGSGASIRTVSDSPYNLSQDHARPSSTDPGRGGPPDGSGNMGYKDVLVQFAKLTNQAGIGHGGHGGKGPPNGVPPPPPPPYPEVTLHPVSRPGSSPPTPPSSSLLHGILTKSSNAMGSAAAAAAAAAAARPPANFSPTLARLLTAPDRPPHPVQPPPHFRPQHPPKMSIADFLSSSKSRNEITITPVSGNPSAKPKEDVVLLQDDDETEPSDRLVIDESADNEEVPQCQGCRQKPAQFVCAGCGNQWYCSRECQVTAWEEHSDVCSG